MKFKKTAVILLSFIVFLDSFPIHALSPFRVKWALSVRKTVGFEMEDPFWIHLHQAHGVAQDSLQSTVVMDILGAAGTPNIEVRYTVAGVPVSNWMSAPPYTFDLNISALDALENGFHALSADVRGTEANDVRVNSIIVHLTGRGRPFLNNTIPLVGGNSDYMPRPDTGTTGDMVITPRPPRKFPTTINRAPWHTVPSQSPLYQIRWTGMFSDPGYAHGTIQSYWADPVEDSSHVFARTAKTISFQDVDDVFRKSWPIIDGFPGENWVSAFIAGEIDSSGALVFAENGGALRYLFPNGRIVTLAGWRVKPGLNPVWIAKPASVVRRNMEIRGNWVGVTPGFGAPNDVALDPTDETQGYVVDYSHNCIYKFKIIDRELGLATVELFAGDPNHQSGLVDGQGPNARFSRPFSISFSPIERALYVIDNVNNALRKITVPDARVTTIFANPTLAQDIRTRGATETDYHSAIQIRSFYRNFEVTAAEAQAGAKPEALLPMCVRVDGVGNVLFSDWGTGTVRRYYIRSGRVEKVAEILNTRDYPNSWAWFDVDRDGNNGPNQPVVNDVYTANSANSLVICKSVGTGFRLKDETAIQANFNEMYAWVSADGTVGERLFGEGTGAYPGMWGDMQESRGPHYPWLVAFDRKRGGIALAGFGESGITRVQLKRPNDVSSREYDYVGRWDFQAGAPDNPGAQIPSISPILKFGHLGWNNLGFADARDLTGNETDAQMIAMFELPAPIVSNPTSLQRVIKFLKANRDPYRETVAPPVNIPPSVSITSPGHGASFTAPFSFTIQVNASDPDGRVDKVEFFVDGALMGSDSTSPFTFDVTNLRSGSRTLTARATDDKGDTRLSLPINVTIIGGSGPQPPIVSMTKPSDGATFTAPAQIALEASATGVDGVVKKVEFLKDNSLLGTLTQPPYQYGWKSVPAGTYNLSARATDEHGSVSVSNRVSVIVQGNGPGGTVSRTERGIVGNPVFTGEAPLQFNLQGNGSVKIFNSLGQSVITVSGNNRVDWMGKNSDGKNVSRGTYGFELKDEAGKLQGKFVVQ